MRKRVVRTNIPIFLRSTNLNPLRVKMQTPPTVGHGLDPQHGMRLNVANLMSELIPQRYT